MCKALDAIVIEPFPSPGALADSYTYHSPCEHVLLTTCNTSSPVQLQVTVNFDPSNLNILGLAVHVNKTKTITVFRDKVLHLKNILAPLFSNRTYAVYGNGISIVNEDGVVSIILAELGVKIDRIFGTEHQILIEVRSTPEVCGLCGTVDGVLLYSDRTTVAPTIDADSSELEELAESWQVSPQEQLLGQQGEECGEYTLKAKYNLYMWFFLPSFLSNV